MTRRVKKSCYLVWLLYAPLNFPMMLRPFEMNSERYIYYVQYFSLLLRNVCLRKISVWIVEVGGSLWRSIYRAPRWWWKVKEYAKEIDEIIKSVIHCNLSDLASIGLTSQKVLPNVIDGMSFHRGSFGFLCILYLLLIYFSIKYLPVSCHLMGGRASTEAGRKSNSQFQSFLRAEESHKKAMLPKLAKHKHQFGFISFCLFFQFQWKVQQGFSNYNCFPSQTVRAFSKAKDISQIFHIF